MCFGGSLPRSSIGTARSGRSLSAASFATNAAASLVTRTSTITTSSCFGLTRDGRESGRIHAPDPHTDDEAAAGSRHV
eukprot:7391460-Prymnesium_polylepis.2